MNVVFEVYTVRFTVSIISKVLTILIKPLSHPTSFFMDFAAIFLIVFI